ncbi:hypothetical protein DdX_01860 [Ditylenchus destructor]|uniref:Uncharacterized protein n=1 Tax=Ditylenchus destructor TaxID=166010 RepID=A0AAD4RDZ5_9BILA|nr:hypothetical protein DdX_01860 [Ditylenchus destructor]
MICNGSSRSHSKLAAIQIVCLLAFMGIALAGRTNEKAKYLLPPVPIEEGMKREGITYRTARNYTVGNFHDIVQGLNRDIKKEVSRVEGKVDAGIGGMAISFEKMLERIVALESKLPSEQAVESKPTVHWQPTIPAQLEVLVIMMSAIFAMVAVSLVVLIFCYCRQRYYSNSPKYTSVEKLVSNM